MNREQKSALVKEIAGQLGDAEAIFAIDYRGISVTQAAELRAKLAESEASFKVVKNRLAKRALEDADGTEELGELLEGPTALTFVKGDPVTAAKAIATFARENDVLAYKGGLMEGTTLEPEQFTRIARLPGLDVLHGQLVGLTASPITGLTRGLASMLSGLASQLGQIQEKGLVEGEAPAEEAPAEEAPAEEAAAEDAETEPPAEGDADPAEPDAGASEADDQSDGAEQAEAEDSAGNDEDPAEPDAGASEAGDQSEEAEQAEAEDSAGNDQTSDDEPEEAQE
jgi:large subunit ribosomal protein L10